MPKAKNISEQLKSLDGIVKWFESQDELDVEAALEKLRTGGALLKELRTRLADVENEFKEIKKDIEA